MASRWRRHLSLALKGEQEFGSGEAGGQEHPSRKSGHSACCTKKKKKKAIFGLGNIVSSIPWLCRIEGSRVAQDPRETKGWACLDSAVTLQSPLSVSLPGARPRPSGLGAEDVVRAVSPACVSTGTRKGGAGH